MTVFSVSNGNEINDTCTYILSKSVAGGVAVLLILVL